MVVLAAHKRSMQRSAMLGIGIGVQKQRCIQRSESSYGCVASVAILMLVEYPQRTCNSLHIPANLRRFFKAQCSVAASRMIPCASPAKSSRYARLQHKGCGFSLELRWPFDMACQRIREVFSKASWNNLCFALVAVDEAFRELESPVEPAAPHPPDWRSFWKG